MIIRTKTLLTIGWLIAFMAICALLQVTRQIGTTWMNEAGFLRILVLMMLVLGALASLLMAGLAWFDRPKSLYKKLS